MTAMPLNAPGIAAASFGRDSSQFVTGPISVCSMTSTSRAFRNITSRAVAAELLREECRDLPRGPDLAVSRYEIAAAIRGGAHERERLQDALDVREVLVEGLA